MYKQKRKLVWAGLVAIAMSALLLGACRKTVGLKFSHRFHIEEQEASCDDCHKTDDDGNRQAATMEQCQACHDIDTDNPSEECLVCHTQKSAENDYEIESSEKPENFADLIFSHDVHSDFKCQQCHVPTDQGKGFSPGPQMDTCLKCHQANDGPLDCESCHEKIRREVEPENHHQDWESKHGFNARLNQKECFYCHKSRQEFCEKCHRTQKPKDHNFSWKTTGHGIEATHDRRLCATCHYAGYCVSCHTRQAPVSHASADWMAYNRENGHAEAAKRNFRSCNVCHQTSQCLKCHRGIVLRKQ